MDSDQKANIYACLWTLIDEEDVDEFTANETTFVTYWSYWQTKFY